MGGIATGWLTPKQDRTKYIQSDPLVNVRPQAARVRNAVFGAAGQGASSMDPTVGPNQWETGALDDLSAMQQEATPAFGRGLQHTQDVAAGKYLDPMQQAGFANVAGDRASMADAIFGQARGNPNMQIDPKLASGTITAQMNRAGQRVQNQTALDTALARYDQYGRERGAQQAAAQRGVEFSPGMAEQVFKGGAAIQSRETDANIAQMEADLRAQGLAQADIDRAIAYVKMASGKTLGPVVSGIPAENADKTASDIYKGFHGGMGGSGGT